MNNKREVTVEDIKALTAIVAKVDEIDNNMALLKIEVKAECDRYDAIMERIRSGK